MLSKFQTEIGLGHGHGSGQHGENEKGSGLGRSSSNASNRSRTEVGSKSKYDHSNLSSEASASAPTLISDQNNTVTSSPASDRPPTITSGFHPLPKPASVKSADTSSTTAITESLGTDIDRSASPGSAAHSASLLESFRARDKQAIAAQVNTAKSVVRKWGIDFAAKRRADFQAPATGTGIKGQPVATQPQAIYRPQEDDRLHSSSSSTAAIPASLGHSPNRTLQERLNDAAKAAAIANSTTNRERSHSNLSNNSSTSSRPTLLASPSKSGAVAGPSISEPTFTLSDQKQKPRRESVPVLMQPSAGRGMVVPRIVKRPGEVTGLGNSPGQGLTRKISETETKTDTPENKTLEIPQRESNEFNRPGVPPPIPKKPDLAEMGIEMQRSGSAPIPSTPSIGDEPNQIISLSKPDVHSHSHDTDTGAETETGDLADTSIPSSESLNVRTSGAQDALRKLADK